MSNKTSITNIIYLLKKMWFYKKTHYLLIILNSVSEIGNGFFVLLITTTLVESLTTETDVSSMISKFLIILLLMIVSSIIYKVSSIIIPDEGSHFRMLYTNELTKKMMCTNYSNIDGSNGQEKLFNALESVASNESAFEKIYSVLASFLSNILGIIFYGYLLTKVHPLFLLLIAIVSVINLFYSLYLNKSIKRNIPILSKLNSKIQYLTFHTVDFKSGKDIRLFNMKGWLFNIFDKTQKERHDIYSSEAKRKFGGNVLNGILVVLRDSIAYIYLIGKIIRGELIVSDFIFYFRSINIISDLMNKLVANFSDFNRISAEVSNFRNFFEINDSSSSRNLVINDDEMPISIEFDNVSFTYPGVNSPTISNFNCFIYPGEKIALVGVNGAGKTTLVKLLCGLYKPTKGKILINNHCIDDYDTDYYFDLFSVVFQEHYTLPTTVKMSITNGNCFDEDKFNEAVAQSGLDKVMENYSDKYETKLVKKIYKDAAELSGGQNQKLQLAQALYKDGPILVLDEPTAALDPIAENEIYMKYNELTKGKTSIFISHRLSSTQFCDRILFLENGEITEEGTHDELMNLNGKYYEMFEAQSYYYKKQDENEAGEIDAEVI